MLRNNAHVFDNRARDRILYEYMICTRAFSLSRGEGSTESNEEGQGLLRYAHMLSYCHLVCPAAVFGELVRFDTSTSSSTTKRRWPTMSRSLSDLAKDVRRFSDFLIPLLEGTSRLRRIDVDIVFGIDCESAIKPARIKDEIQLLLIVDRLSRATMERPPALDLDFDMLARLSLPCGAGDGIGVFANLLNDRRAAMGIHRDYVDRWDGCLIPDGNQSLSSSMLGGPSERTKDRVLCDRMTDLLQCGARADVVATLGHVESMFMRAAFAYLVLAKVCSLFMFYSVTY